MKRDRFLLVLLSFMGLVLLVGCGATTDKPIIDTLATVCKDPRMQMCTRDYTPVCGVDKAGEFKTYSNGCTACSSEYVIGYNAGPCETDVVRKKP